MNAIKRLLMQKGNSEAEAEAIVQEIIEDSSDAVDNNDMEGIEEALDAHDVPPDYVMNVLTALATYVR